MVPSWDSVVSEDGKTVQLLTMRCGSGLGTLSDMSYSFACLLVFSGKQSSTSGGGGGGGGGGGYYPPICQPLK